MTKVAQGDLETALRLGELKESVDHVAAAVSRFEARLEAIEALIGELLTDPATAAPSLGTPAGTGSSSASSGPCSVHQ